MSMPFSFSHYLAAHARLADALDAEAFQGGIEVVRAAFERGSQVITCGNGGSAHTASHYITDWSKAITLATRGNSTSAQNAPCKSRRRPR